MLSNLAKDAKHTHAFIESLVFIDDTHHGVSATQMKNWEPFVFGPAFAMERVPRNRKKWSEIGFFRFI